jgi:hypothetical protein
MKNLGIADAKHRRSFEEQRPKAAFAPSPQGAYALGLVLDTWNLDMIQAWDEDSP